MKASQRVALEMSEKREKLNGLLGVDEMSDEQRAEMGSLTERMQQLEVEAQSCDPGRRRADGYENNRQRWRRPRVAQLDRPRQRRQHLRGCARASGHDRPRGRIANPLQADPECDPVDDVGDSCCYASTGASRTESKPRLFRAYSRNRAPLSCRLICQLSPLGIAFIQF